MKIFVIGNGFIADHLPYDRLNIRLDKSNIHHIGSAKNEYGMDVLINCIGKTGRPNIDWCETHKEETTFANTILPIRMAEECARNEIYLIHISSGCIYFGRSPNYRWHTDIYGEMKEIDFGWKETDFANPQSYYSKTKYACDLILGDMANVASLRIRMPISEKNNPRNLINKLLKYEKIIDIPNSMTLMTDFVRCIEYFVKNRFSGIYHITNPQPTSAASIMKEYQKYVPSHNFDIIDERILDNITLAKRSNCILNTDKLQSIGFNMTETQEGLKKCMAAYVANIGKEN
jgi:UDP-glucose 4,6-dehydratase